MSVVYAVLLAAGSSQRMGDANKLLLEFNGKPLVRQAALTVVQSGVTECYVVLGYEQEAVAQALADLPVQLVVNEAHTSGQASSVLSGLSRLPTDADAVMICLSDQPLLLPEHLAQLQSAFFEQQEISACSVLVPMVNGQRGNPVIFSGEVAASLVKTQTPPRQFIDSAQQSESNSVVFKTFDVDAFVVDVDTMQDWEAVHAQ